MVQYKSINHAQILFGNKVPHLATLPTHAFQHQFRVESYAALHYVRIWPFYLGFPVCVYTHQKVVIGKVGTCIKHNKPPGGYNFLMFSTIHTVITSGVR